MLMTTTFFLNPLTYERRMTLTEVVMPRCYDTEMGFHFQTYIVKKL